MQCHASRIADLVRVLSRPPLETKTSKVPRQLVFAAFRSLALSCLALSPRGRLASLGPELAESLLRWRNWTEPFALSSGLQRLDARTVHAGSLGPRSFQHRPRQWQARSDLRSEFRGVPWAGPVSTDITSANFAPSIRVEGRPASSRSAPGSASGALTGESRWQ